MIAILDYRFERFVRIHLSYHDTLIIHEFAVTLDHSNNAFLLET